MTGCPRARQPGREVAVAPVEVPDLRSLGAATLHEELVVAEMVLVAAVDLELTREKEAPSANSFKLSEYSNGGCAALVHSAVDKVQQILAEGRSSTRPQEWT